MVPDKHATPFVSIIIPVLNAVDEVPACLDALRAQDYPTDRYEIIVVDNGSSDGTFELLQQSGVSVLQRSERGRAKALNAGVQHARGEIICTTDISCQADANWLRTIVVSFDDPTVACVAGEIKQLAGIENAVTRFQARTNYMSPMRALNRKHLPFLPFADGANASFRRSVFDQIGWFEESFSKGADVEICYRLFVLTPHKILFNYDAVVWEPGEPTLRALLYQRYRMGIGWNLMKLRFPELFMQQQAKKTARELYWQLRGSMSRGFSLAVRNARALFGDGRDGAMDANLTLMMGLAQWYGKVRGRKTVLRQMPKPEPIDSRALRVFIDHVDSIPGRVMVVHRGAE